MRCCAGKRPCRADSGTGAGTSKRPDTDQEVPLSEDTSSDDPLQYTEAERYYIISWPFDTPGCGGMIQAGSEERRKALIRGAQQEHHHQRLQHAGLGTAQPEIGGPEL